MRGGECNKYWQLIVIDHILLHYEALAEQEQESICSCHVSVLSCVLSHVYSHAYILTVLAIYVYGYVCHVTQEDYNQRKEAYARAKRAEDAAKKKLSKQAAAEKTKKRKATDSE